MSAPTFTVTADDVRLATYEWGNPAGPALVLVHGFAQCHLCFAPQVGSALARERRYNQQPLQPALDTFLIARRGNLQRLATFDVRQYIPPAQ